MTDKSRFERLREACADALPHPDIDEMRSLCDQITRYVLQDFADLPKNTAGRSNTRPALEAMLREPAPSAGKSFAECLTEFDEKVAAFAFRPNHPRFFAFIPGAPNFISVLGDWLCSAMNYFDGVWLEAAGPAQVELVVLDWFKQMIGFPIQDSGGILTMGGSEANLTALAAARDTLPVERRPHAVLYETDQRHWSIDRAARIIGLLAHQIRPVAADEDFRLNPNALRNAIVNDLEKGLTPWVIVANAGATNTGTIDPLRQLAEVAAEFGCWFHVDAAYGWSAVLTDEGRRQLEGIDRADSITLDPHKWFGQTFECGCVLIRNGQTLFDAFSMRPEYMQDVAPQEDEINFADYGIALTRRFRALKIWLSVKVLGLDWFRKLVNHCCRLAEFAEELLRRTNGFEIVCARQLSIVCFRIVPNRQDTSKIESTVNELNLKVAEALRIGGHSFLSTTRLHGKVALRLCFVNWRTRAVDVQRTVELLATIAEQMIGAVDW